MEEPISEMQKRDVLRMSNEESNRLTRECLQTALIYLMHEKPFEKITITELVKRSGVSRTAFYRNYNTKEELLSEICDELTGALVDSISLQKYTENPREWYAQFFTYIQENQDLVRLLLQADMLKDSILGKESILEKTFSPDSPEERYTYNALEGALVMTCLGWFSSGMQESVSFMADFCADMHMRILGTVPQNREGIGIHSEK
ncbi:MAG: TetR/AcrR family transcriptional regulator [Ruminococcus sp.]